jgi:hypothetical protein
MTFWRIKKNFISWMKFRNPDLLNTIRNTGRLFNYGMSALNVTSIADSGKCDRTRKEGQERSHRNGSIVSRK